MSSRQALLEARPISLDEAPEEAVAEGSLADRWHHRDAVHQLVDELFATGRTEEAKLVGAILTSSVAAEDMAVRAFLTSDWAEDWNSPEDSVYDRM